MKFKYSRAIVLEIKDQNVKILLIDYGIIENMHISKVFEIPENSEILDFPRMGIHCKLSNVKPINGEWNDEAIKYFHSIVCDRILSVEVVKNDVPPIPVKLNRLSGNQKDADGPNLLTDISLDLEKNGYLKIFK